MKLTLPAAALAAGLLLSACGGSDTSNAPAPASAASSFGLSSAPLRPKGAPDAAAARPLAGTDQPEGLRVDTSQREAVMLFMRSVLDSTSGVPVDWTGNFAACNAGDSSAANKAAVERRINWVRAMAGVPAAVRLDASLNQKAQQTALMMGAQGQLSHAPPPTWACWTAVGADGAGNSNLTQSAGASAITEDYLHDHGDNNAAVGHRRWLLYPQTRTMGTGDVEGSNGTRTVAANALWIFDSQIDASRPAVRDGFVAWPPPGYVPHTTVYPRWSFSYPDAAFTNARVTMSENGQPMATQLEAQAVGYGENTLVWFPGSWRDGMNWARPAADARYEVTVSNVLIGGVARSFSYAVTVFDAQAAAPWAGAGSVSGNAMVTAAAAARFNFKAVSGATAYQWLSRPLAPLVFAEGAEAGGGGVVIGASAGYDTQPAGVAAEGTHSFHLAHVQPADQTIRLRPTVVPATGTRLRFASRLALATSNQSALVEVSADEGRNWATIYRQDGTGDAGERGFVVRDLPMAAYVGQTVQLRFRYARPIGSYYPQATDGIGWYIDDIRLIEADTVTDVGITSETNAPTQALSLPTAGRWLVQARPGMYGTWPAWSAGLVVQAASNGARLDCLFDWAQNQYPDLLTPAAKTQSASPYLYRAYAGEIYVGWSSVDAHIHALSGGVLSDLGATETWLSLAGC